MGSTLGLVRTVLFVIAVGLFLQVHGVMTPMYAVPVSSVSLAASADDQCDQVCGIAADCEEPCLNDLFETTCGEYDGGGANGWCLGECGDIYCNWFAENGLNCYEDCGSCGDGLCAPAWEMPGASAYCEQDCGDDHVPYPPGPSCDPEGQIGCDEFEACDSAQQCVPYTCAECCNGANPCSDENDTCIDIFGDGNGWGECVPKPIVER